MSIQIINNGPSLKIVTDGVARLILKLQIREISVIKTNIIKIDLGLGALHNIFIAYPDVTNPVTANPEALRDAINTMMLSSITGGATESKQVEEITELQQIKTSVNDLKSKIDLVNDKIFFDPLLVDESNPLTIYRGFAITGANPANPVWAIQRGTISGDVTTFAWADGNKNFDNIWNNRTTLTYN